jgi:hypothetical protein
LAGGSADERIPGSLAQGRAQCSVFHRALGYQVGISELLGETIDQPVGIGLEQTLLLPGVKPFRGSLGFS